MRDREVRVTAIEATSTVAGHLRGDVLNEMKYVRARSTWRVYGNPGMQAVTRAR